LLAINLLQKWALGREKKDSPWDAGVPDDLRPIAEMIGS